MHTLLAERHFNKNKLPFHYLIHHLITSNVYDKRAGQTTELATPVPFYLLSSTTHHGSTKYYSIAL